MKLLASANKSDLATVYLAELDNNNLIEFVESVQPPLPRKEKWVLIVSTLFGCPVGCSICDAGQQYRGKLSREEIFAQIDFLIKKRYPGGCIPVKKFKIQFARMGEPAFNWDVLRVLEELPYRYRASGLIPSISTVAPDGTDPFFAELFKIKHKLYNSGNFQLQFSIHTTDRKDRDNIIPIKKWGFSKIAKYGEEFFRAGDRKIALNFALANEAPLDHHVIFHFFNPEKFLIKVTPLNPTYRSRENNLSTYIDPYNPEIEYDIVNNLRNAGYEVIVSIGSVEENLIGSNCGQYISAHLKTNRPLPDGYTYDIR